MAQKPKNGQRNKEEDISVKIDWIVNRENSNIRAVASVNVSEAFAVHGLCVVDSQNGLFVRMPQQSYMKDGKTMYSDIFHPITAEARKELSDKVLDAYEQAINEGQNESEKIENEIEPDDPAMSM